MKISINKTKMSTIALVLVLTIAATLTWLPTANAVLPDQTTYPGITVTPDPVGVGQRIDVIMFLNFLPASEGFEFQQVVGEPYEIPHGGWKGFVLTITKPDGTTTNMGPYETDPSGMYHVTYIPATVGTYQFQFTFPGQTEENRTWGGRPGAHFYYNAYFLPSTSRKVTITVQEEPLTGYQETLIPWGEYWDRPIEAESRSWSVLGGAWLQPNYNASGPFNPYTQAPKTAHIVWTKPLMLGGIIGGEYGSMAFARSQHTHFSGSYSPRCIIGGRLYYNGLPSSDGSQQLYCIDLRTGEDIWDEPVPISISQAQILCWRSLQEKTNWPYLWSFGSTYRQYDADTGRLLVTYTGARSGTAVMQPPNPTLVPGTEAGGAAGGGELLVYMTGTDGTTDWIACWNSTLAMYSYAMDYHFVKLPPSPWPWINGLQWNVTFPYFPFAAHSGIGSGTISPYSIMYATPDVIIVAKASYGTMFDNATEVASKPYAGINAITGERMWFKNITWIPYTFGDGRGYAMSEGVFTLFDKATMTVHAYDAYSGDKLWEASPMKNDFAMMSSGGATPAYGNIYLGGYDGYMHCIDLETGIVEWSTISTISGLEIPEEAYPLGGPVVGDGRVYAATTKSYPPSPLYRGHKLICWDAFSGDQVWSVLGRYSSMALADGYLTAGNSYDNQLYCFGKGQTATTVSVPDTAVPLGESVLIRGTVTDQSPGAPEGTPCIADVDMSEWMEYLYMQKPCPTDITGVPVYLTAFASDGSMIDLGYVISDEYGNFHKPWTAPDQGVYKIMATMLTTDSYYTSYAATDLFVGPPTAPAVPIEPLPTEPLPTEPLPTEPAPTEPAPTEPAPTEPAPTEPEPTEPTEAPFITTEVAIIAAVAIATVIGIVSFWLLKKRK